jgi:dipeptidyl aminopeptidase/acylaminoacyl peptidase
MVFDFRSDRPEQRRGVRSAALLLAFSIAAGLGEARESKPMEPADQFALQDVGEVRISPDASTIVFSVTTTDLAANRSTSQLMRVAAAGGNPTVLEGVPAGANTVRWSPDSRKIAFFATVDGRGGIWVYDLASAQLTRVCDYDRTNRFISKTGNALAWSPDGTRLAFTGTLEPVARGTDPYVTSRIQYKTRTALSDDRRLHIYVVPLPAGAPKALTTGDFDEHSIDWEGDGSEIVFLSNRESDPDANHNYDIYAISVSSGRVRQITRTPGVEMEPRVSPDGRWIAYTATTRTVTTIDSVAEDAHVFVVSASGGTPQELNHALDRRSSSPEWTPDGMGVLYTASDRGKTVLYRVSVKGGASVALIDRKAQVGPFSMARDGLIAIGISDPTMPREVFRFRPDAALHQVTSLNAAAVRSLKLVSPETITFKSFDGTEIEGWYYPPAGANGSPARPADASSPLILSIHGGPHGMYGYGFNAGFQIQSGHGYATLALNPRGSSGYGQAFSDGTLLNWGGTDYKDLMAGVDHVLKLKPEIDKQRLAVMGGSYGGFMTNWVITQTTRFKAAVSSASVSNLVSFYATSLYQDLVHAEFDGFPWDGSNTELLWKWSPLAHVKQVTTPTLFIHGEQDNDVHITDAEQMYTAMRRRGVDAALARYPREGHGFREPKHIVDRLERTLAWFDRYLGQPSARPTSARQ